MSRTNKGRGAGATTKSKGEGGSTRVDRSKRLLDLVMLLLRARAPVTFRDIREQFPSYLTANVEAGLRAFERDKADLLELGVPIRYVTPDEDDALEEGGYVIDLKRYRLPEVRLTADEVSALVLAASIARAVPGGTYPKIVDLALKKLSFDVPEPPDTPTMFPPPVGTVARRESVLVHFPEPTNVDAKELSERFSQLEQAMRFRKRVTIRYQNASTAIESTRDVDPYGLVYRDGAWILVGHCHLRAEVRSFRVDRIHALNVAPKPKSPDFERPQGFDVRAYAARSPWTFRTAPVEEIILEIHPEAQDIANEDFGPEATLTRGDHGVLTVALPCGNVDFAVSKVLAAKGAILVKQGDRLRKRLEAELTAIAEHYE